MIHPDKKSSTRNVPAVRLLPGGTEPGERTLPVEAPVAIEYNGIGYAVFMATPADLEDFALGFSLTERIVEHAGQIEDVEAFETEKGWILRVQIAAARSDALFDRVRSRVSESSCGLCGVENLEMAIRPLTPLTARITLDRAALFAALGQLGAHQPLNRQTGAVHAAAFCDPARGVLIAREDVGRHSALDKLIGAALRAGHDLSAGYILATSRCSYELVEKCVVAGCPALVTLSSATSLAVDRARAARLTLIALARPDAMLLLNDPGADASD